MGNFDTSFHRYGGSTAKGTNCCLSRFFHNHSVISERTSTLFSQSIYHDRCDYLMKHRCFQFFGMDCNFRFWLAILRKALKLSRGLVNLASARAKNRSRSELFFFYHLYLPRASARISTNGFDILNVRVNDRIKGVRDSQ